MEARFSQPNGGSDLWCYNFAGRGWRIPLNASGSILKFDGLLKLSDKKELAEEKEKPVPFLSPATALKVAELQPAKQHFTEPPAYFTEATLVKELKIKELV